MAVISRPPKALGNANYADEVAQGKPDIVDIEVDADFNALYDLQNHKIDTANLSPTAEITYAQLHHPIGIQPSDLAAGFIAPPNTINGGSIVQDSITTRELAPNSVILENIAPTQATAAMVENGDDAAFNVPVGVQTLLCEAVWTARGGWWLAIASISGHAHVFSEQQDIYLQLLLDGNAADPNTGSLRHQVVVSINTSSFAGSATSPVIPFSATLIAQGQFLLPTAQPGTHRLKVAIRSTSGTNTDVVVVSKRIIIHETA